MPLAVRMERVAAFGERSLHPDRRDGVLQRAAGANVHVDVAGGHLRQAGRVRERRAMREPRGIAGAGEELDRDPRAAGEGGGDPARGGERSVVAGARSPGRIRRHPEREEAGRERLDIAAGQRVAALLARCAVRA